MDAGYFLIYMSHKKKEAIQSATRSSHQQPPDVDGTPPGMFRRPSLSKAGHLASHECTQGQLLEDQGHPRDRWSWDPSEGTRTKMYVAVLISPR